MTKKSVPSTIATAFPDNVQKPFWAFKDNRSLADEFFDCYVSFKELGCQEYFWDWQSRKLDEVLVKQLINSYSDFFKTHPIGKSKFLTFVVDTEDTELIAKLYMSVILTNEFTKEKKLHSPPIFEVVHSARTSDSLLRFINLYNESVGIACDKMKRDVGPKQLGIIPKHDFFADSSKWFKQLHDFLSEYQNNFRSKVETFRPVIPRAAHAGTVGFVASVLATKRAISNYHTFADMMNLDSRPIIEASTLMYRGGLSPSRVKEFAATYPGMSSVTLSSSFRYDHDPKSVIESIKQLNRGLPRIEPFRLSKSEGTTIKMIEDIFAKHHVKRMKAFPDIAREGVDPRIRDSFALYSLGIPPEFVGAGPALLEIIDKKMTKDLESLYPSIKQDLVTAGRLLNKENARLLSATDPFFRSYLKDIALVEDYAGTLGPENTDDFVHRNHTSNVFHKKKDCSKDLIEAARARHCMG